MAPSQESGNIFVFKYCLALRRSVSITTCQFRKISSLDEGDSVYSVITTLKRFLTFRHASLKFNKA